MKVAIYARYSSDNQRDASIEDQLRQCRWLFAGKMTLSDVQHFAPLFVTLGASSNPEQTPDQVIDGFWMGLSKRSIQVG